MKKHFLPLLLMLLSVTAAIGQTITGPTSGCVGSSTTLTGTPAGGVWTCTAPGIISSGGVITGTLAGTSFVTYATGSGSAVVPFTLNPNPSPITGPATSLILCGTVTLSSTPSGGTWTSSNPSVVAVNATTGVITGMSFGVPPTITYTLPTGCYATVITSVTPSSVVVSGIGRICTGNSTTFSSTVTGFGSVPGTWSSSSPGIASVNPSGIVTGLSSGTATISFTPSCGISGTKIVTVSTTGAAGAMLGTASVCVGSSTTLTCTPAGGTWASSNPSVATVSSGIVYGNMAGTSTISYVYAACPSGTATKVVTANAIPASCPGTPVVCVGSTTTMSCPGAWSGGSPLVSVTPSGVVTGLSVGSAILTYSNASGCYNTDTVSVMLAPGAISGATLLCAGTTSTLSAFPGGGMWGSSNPAVASVSSSGIVTGVSAGTALITYGLTTGCVSSVVVTVGAAGPGCSGLSPLCVGSTLALTCAGTGATWSTSGPNASITPTGVVTALVSGTAVLTYTAASGCTSTVTLPIAMAPGPITGPATICAGSSATLSSSIGGASWSSSDPSVATVTSVPAGVVTGVAPGTATITQTTTFGCSSGTVITVVAGAGSITASAIPVTCGSSYILTASGGAGAYTWSPAAGLACSTCPTVIVNPSMTTTYVVSGTTSAGCAASAIVIVGGANRIYGHINFAMGMPSSPACKVWLVQYNPIDSSITALDSTLSCMDGSTPYYQFTGVPAGNYFVKAKLLSSIAGTSGYVPTYGLSTPNWYSASNISHGSVGSVQNINMVYGTVPAGPGFISGYVYAGAGKGTADGAPVAGMLIYLRNNMGAILTHAYTDASGGYTFSGLANGSYVIYPEEYDYYTTPSSILSLNASTPNVSGVNFKQHTNNGTITPLPIVVNSVNNVVVNSDISVYPNPAAGNVFIQWRNQDIGNAEVAITDVLGREVYRSNIGMTAASGEAQVNIHSLNSGVYFISIQANNSTRTEKLLLQK